MLLENQKMFALRAKSSADSIKRNNEMYEIAKSGFETIGGCYFLKKLLPYGANVSQRDFIDKTGYECFINSVNVDDYVGNSYLEHGLELVRNALSAWREFNNQEVFVAIISYDDIGAKVRFHLDRMNENWLSDDLESYDEAILIVDSSELGFLRSG